ncbi:MAG: endopeptidase La [Eubacterium sp.]|nr:endopeptidase La [Eubacterium sp.]
MNELKSYMIIPMYDTIVLPDVEYQFGSDDFTEEEKSRIKIDGNKAILLPMKEPKERSEMTLEDFYGLGVLADVLEILETNIGTRVHVHTREKVKVLDFHATEEILEGSWQPQEEIVDINADGEKALLDQIKEVTLDISQHIQGGNLVQNYIKAISSISDYAAMFCQFYGMTPEEKYALLETDSLKQRGLLVHEALLRFKGTIDLQVDLNKRYNDTEGNLYKKAAIQKQIGLLQDELDSMDPETASTENEYKQKIEASGMPEEARKEVDRVLKRYLQSQPNDPERSSMENYLDFVTALQWKIEEIPPVDLKKAKKVLDRDHYGLEKIKERMLQQIAVMTLKQNQGGSILLLVGAPGTGKTSLGKSVAEALGRKYVRVSLGGIRDEAEIRGHRRTYVGAMPGRIMDGIKRSGAMNPVVVLDEVDKLARGFEGDPASALLEVLDPEQNNTFTDHYMNIPYDLSNVFFICTANTYDTIPQPLLDRMEMIQLPGYTPIEKLQIAKKHLLPRALEDAGIDKKQLRVTDGAIRRIINEYTMESGVRGLKKQLDILCRKTAAKIVEQLSETEAATRKAQAAAAEAAEAAEAAAANPDDPSAVNDSAAAQEASENTPLPIAKELRITVREKNIPEFLGNKGILHDRILKHCPPGVATGLAWTMAGGEILFIETTFMKGSGNIILTGQLGDVMKESATIALSLVKSLFVSDDVDFNNKDIHIHVPDGAVPKDGPSAGVTMFTALVSLVTGKSVQNDLAMTGEISLRGQVLPIGGLPEKLMAAQRAGVKKVLIPKDNVRDLEDVAKEVRDTLEIVPVSSVQDVIDQALHVKLPKRKHLSAAKE